MPSLCVLPLSFVVVQFGSRQAYEELPWTDPARSVDARPEHSGYFTARPQFYDQLLQLERIQEQLDAMPVRAADPEAPAPARKPREISQVSWLKKDEMGAKLGVPLTISEYRSLITLLQTLWAHPHGDLAREEISAFLRPAAKQFVDKREYKLDALGRSYATGFFLTNSEKRRGEGAGWFSWSIHFAFFLALVCFCFFFALLPSLLINYFILFYFVVVGQGGAKRPRREFGSGPCRTKRQRRPCVSTARTCTNTFRASLTAW